MSRRPGHPHFGMYFFRPLQLSSNPRQKKRGDKKSRLISTAPNYQDGKSSVEECWRQFFSDPSQWWDHTIHKVNPKYPDYEHKKTGVTLWIDNRFTPSWVKTELMSMTPGSASRSLYSWNSMISGCVNSNQGLDALKLYNQMQAEGVQPNSFTFARVIKACASLRALEEGRRVHAQVLENGCESDVFVRSTLVDMYAKCGSIEDAEIVFHKMHTRNDVVLWGAMLAGFVNCEECPKALKLFQQMQAEGVKPDSVSFVLVLKACASLMALDKGRYIHEQAIESGFDSNAFVGNSLVDMYAKCGSIEDAQRVFCKIRNKNVVSWTTMLDGYVKCGQGQKAVEDFPLMQEEGVIPNAFTFVAVLNACASVMALEEGRLVHVQTIDSGFESDVYVGSSLIDMYTKCGSIADAERVFHRMHTPDVVSWGAMLAGYAKCHQGQKALKLFALMQEEGLRTNSATFVVVLNACASLMALEEGRHLHTQVIESGFDTDLFVGTALVDMYAKCGSIEDAQKVFYAMPSRNVVSWNAMLGSFAMHGQAREAFQLFQEMCEAGVELNMITFICLLSACSHGGLIEEGVQLFECMGPVYGISHTYEHYICMIDLLGRAGYLDKAEDLLWMEPKLLEDSAALRTLLGACRNHGNMEMGKRIAQQLFELDPHNSAGYVLLSNIYAAAG